MKRPGTPSRSSLLLFAPAIGIGVMLAGVPAVDAAQPRTGPVVGWLHRHADPLRTVDPAAPLDDLAPLRRSIGDAAVVGLGESVHGAAEQSRLKHRVLRLLVERMGFRSIAWEVDWTMGVRIDAYIRTGEGDLDAIMREIIPSYRTREVADVLRRLRDFNAGRADKVRFFGVEYFLTRPRAYDAVEAHVAAVAPERLPEVRRHLDVIQPDESDMWKYIEWYSKVEDKERYTRHARELRALVASLPHRPDDRAHALAMHRARQIVYFYEHFGLAEPDSHAYRDARAARNLKWWRDRTGDKVVYWAASPHTANAPKLRITRPPQSDMRFASAGSYLRRWYGGRYRSVGFTFDHGTVSTGGGGTAVLPPPARDWFERPFGKVRTAQFTIDLREPAPPPVRRWLDAPIETRGLPHVGSGSYMSGGTLRQWFDVVVHRQVVTPA